MMKSNNIFKNIADYKNVRNAVTQMFTKQKIGQQHLMVDQANLFKPITDVTKEETQKLVNTISNDRQNLENMLVPLTNEIIRGNNQRDELALMPFHSSEIHEDSGNKSSTPNKNEVQKPITVDFDGGFDETDLQNLYNLGLDLPSNIYKNHQMETSLETITTINRRIGQKLKVGNKTPQKDKDEYESQKRTAEKLRSRLKEIQEADKIPKQGSGLKKSKSVRQKRKRGRPKTNNSIIYRDADDLAQKLQNNVIAYLAGNNGLENVVIDILDELLKLKAIAKNEYDQLYKKYFPVI